MYNTIQTNTFAGNRSSFLSKVFSLFGLSLLSSLLGVFIGMQALIYFPVLFTNTLFYYLIFFAELILIFTSRSWSQKEGLNYALFFLFTLLSGFTLVPILIVASAVGGIMLIMKALGATVALFLGVAVYGYITQRDLTGMRGFLFLSLIGIIVASLINFFVRSSFFEYAISWIVVVVFSGFVMYDIQMIKTRYSDNMYIMAAIALYLDFFNLFVHILNIMMHSKR